jgi:hypothetical protein
MPGLGVGLGRFQQGLKGGIADHFGPLLVVPGLGSLVLVIWSFSVDSRRSGAAVGIATWHHSRQLPALSLPTRATAGVAFHHHQDPDHHVAAVRITAARRSSHIFGACLDDTIRSARSGPARLSELWSAS